MKKYLFTVVIILLIGCSDSKIIYEKNEVESITLSSCLSETLPKTIKSTDKLNRIINMLEHTEEDAIQHSTGKVGCSNTMTINFKNTQSPVIVTIPQRCKTTSKGNSSLTNCEPIQDYIMIEDKMATKTVKSRELYEYIQEGWK